MNEPILALVRIAAQDDWTDNELATLILHFCDTRDIPSVPPGGRLNALIDEDDLFRKTWNHHRPDLADQSLSTYDYHLVARATWHGWIKDECFVLIRAHRERWTDPSGKGDRADYLERTWRAAFDRYCERMIRDARESLRTGQHPRWFSRQAWDAWWDRRCSCRECEHCAERAAAL